MRKIIVFNQISLDGYFTGSNGDLSWAHKSRDDREWNDFVSGNAGGEGMLLFGRVTYEMMVSYWPTPMAAKNDPEVAEGMNSRAKIVFSRSLKHSNWNNTKIVADLLPGIREMKKEPGSDLVILGSGTIVSQLTQQNLIDIYQIVVNPIALGKGRTMFEGLDRPLDLHQTESRTFSNGNTLLTYEAIR